MVREVTTTRERHVQCCDDHHEGETPVCLGCLDDQTWPCDAIREADRADKAEAALANIHHPCDGDADGEWPHCACHCPDQTRSQSEGGHTG